MEEQHHICPAAWCGSGAWLAQPTAAMPGVWQLTHASDGGAWTVAAPNPVCPRCGTTLITILELEGGLGEDDILKPSKLLDWVLTL
jgi:ribosomal protein S27AE